jgi:hypothetical protein
VSITRKKLESPSKSSAPKKRLESDMLDQYLDEILAQAPPISSAARAKLSNLLGAPSGRRAA